MSDFGNVTCVDLRDVWPNEATDFTPWLGENLAALGKALDLELELHGREAAVGSFSCDLVAVEIGSNRKVVIENQLTQTDHDHLGKIVTYAAGLDADIVVWIAREAREEHRQAIEWLNERTGTETDFFLVVVKLFRIDDSRPAFSFDLVAHPNEWQKEQRVSLRQGTSPTSEAYGAFNQELVDILREHHGFTNARTGNKGNWQYFSTGVRGVRYGFTFSKPLPRVELYIDCGDATLNKALFDSLFEIREEIESAAGTTLEWERLNEKRACRIALYNHGAVDPDAEGNAALRDWAIGHLLLFKGIFDKRLGSHWGRIATST